MKQIITYGIYNFLQEGSFKLLRWPKSLGGYLIVELSLDACDHERGKLNMLKYVFEDIEKIKFTGLLDEVIINECIVKKNDSLQFRQIDVFPIGSDLEGKHYYLKCKKFCDRNSTLLDHIDVPYVFINALPFHGKHTDLFIRIHGLLLFRIAVNILAVRCKDNANNLISFICRQSRGQLRSVWDAFFCVFNRRNYRTEVLDILNQLLPKDFSHESEIIFKFEENQICIATQYNQILSQVYGYYIPHSPVKKQFSRLHLSFLNLDKRRSMEYVMHNLKN